MIACSTYLRIAAWGFGIGAVLGFLASGLLGMALMGGAFGAFCLVSLTARFETIRWLFGRR